jgi:hypothetical protein
VHEAWRICTLLLLCPARCWTPLLVCLCVGHGHVSVLFSLPVYKTGFHYSVTRLTLLSQPRVFYSWFLLIACNLQIFPPLCVSAYTFFHAIMPYMSTINTISEVFAEVQLSYLTGGMSSFLSQMCARFRLAPHERKKCVRSRNKQERRMLLFVLGQLQTKNYAPHSATVWCPQERPS